MIMSAGLDEGDVLKIIKEPILEKDTNQTLRERLVNISAKGLGNILDDWINEKITPVKQDSSKATYCWQKDISKENAEIKWNDMEPEYIERLVRAMIPWPVAWCKLDMNTENIYSGKILKLFEVELFKNTSELKPGTLYHKDNMLLLSTKNKDISLRVLQLQIEGKNKISERDFLNGFER